MLFAIAAVFEQDIKGYSIRTDYSFGKTTRRAPEPDADRGRGSRPPQCCARLCPPLQAGSGPRQGPGVPGHSPGTGPYDRPSGSSRGYDRDRCDRNRVQGYHLSQSTCLQTSQGG